MPLTSTEKETEISILNKILEAELAGVAGRSVMLEEYARTLIAEEEQHAGEVDTMLRKPGTLAEFGDASPDPA